MESEKILGPQFAFTGQPAPQSMENDFPSPIKGLGKCCPWEVGLRNETQLQLLTGLT